MKKKNGEEDDGTRLYLDVVQSVQKMVGLLAQPLGLDPGLKVKNGNLNPNENKSILSKYFPKQDFLPDGSKVDSETLVVDTEAFADYFSETGLPPIAEILEIELWEIVFNDCRTILQTKIKRIAKSLLDDEVIGRVGELGREELVKEMILVTTKLQKTIGNTESFPYFEQDAMIAAILCREAIQFENLDDNLVIIALILKMTKDDFMENPEGWLAMIYEDEVKTAS